MAPNIITGLLKFFTAEVEKPQAVLLSPQKTVAIKPKTLSKQTSVKNNDQGNSLFSSKLSQIGQGVIAGDYINITQASTSPQNIEQKQNKGQSTFKG